ncbi:hypothetical protein [Methyloprofundus sp.]|uniref:hypothetical protein n=1 Tax=Methyloprofundus sp. TaxID=2020875 RepID=UPI003D132155
MPKRSLLYIITLLSLNFIFVPKLFAHAGVDHGDNCSVHVAGFKLRLGGFQSASKVGGGKHYCQLFPATGEVIFTFDPDLQLNNRKLNLKLLSADSYWDVLFDYDNAFKQIVSQANNALTIAHHFPRAGLYALQVSLPSDELEPSMNNSQRLVFLVGLPVIKILVLVGFGFLLILAFVLFRQLQAGVVEKS